MAKSRFDRYVRETLADATKARRDELAAAVGKAEAELDAKTKAFREIVDDWIGISERDEIFNVMYNVDMELRCGAGLRTMRYRHEPKVIDGVVYVALENPLDIHWRVNIGRIELDKSENEKND